MQRADLHRFRVIQKKPNKPRHATTSSRPVYMIFPSFNLNPVIDARSRFHEKDCQ